MAGRAIRFGRDRAPGVPGRKAAPPPRAQGAIRVQAKAGCACGGTCPACRAEDEAAAAQAAASVQPKLVLGAPDDYHEHEADSVADRVMRMTAADLAGTPERPRTTPLRAAPGASALLRQPLDEEEEPVQAKGAAGPVPVATGAARAIGRLQGSGRPLAAPVRAFFEPRFAADLSGVRVHDGAAADTAARTIGARAFTLGHDIAFAQGEYAPGTPEGGHLLAHELAHVLQQSGGTVPRVQRLVAGNSICTAGTGGAPADAMDRLRAADAMATSMALGASMSLDLEMLLFRDPTFGPSIDYEAYAHWFGTPRQTPAGRWRSRFRTATFATENEAAAHEMQTISERLARVSRWLSGNVRYRCTGNAPFAVPGCRPGPCGNAAAQTCPTGSRTVRICPNFWPVPAPQDRAQAGLLIHEAIHPLFHFRAHGTADPDQRARNPGCYEGFVHEVFGTGILPGDCTRLP